MRQTPAVVHSTLPFHRSPWIRDGDLGVVEVTGEQPAAGRLDQLRLGPVHVPTLDRPPQIRQHPLLGVEGAERREPGGRSSAAGR